MEEAKYYLYYTDCQGESHAIKVQNYCAKLIRRDKGEYLWGKKRILSEMEQGMSIRVPYVSEGNRSGWSSIASKMSKDSAEKRGGAPTIRWHIEKSHDTPELIITRVL